MGFDLTPASLVTSFVVSGVAYVLFSYGKKSSRTPHLLAGIILFASGWLIQAPLASAGFTVIILALLWFVVQRLGY